MRKFPISNKIYSANLHFWPYCNMKCKYCYTNFSHIKNILSKEDWFEIIRKLNDFGVKKINFVGGEPTLCPFLGELIVFSKKEGVSTSIVSNGKGIIKRFLDQSGNCIDWIGLSLDSGNEKVQKTLGRGNGNYVRSIINKSKIVKKFGIKLKINTVITRLNYFEDMSIIIHEIKPDRWKVFQILEIKGQNSLSIKDLLITVEEFEEFIKINSHLSPIAENNDAMIESYIMIDPRGRFFQNSSNIYHYSRPILEVGVQAALNDVKFNHAKFIKRGGIYAF